jgi:hypothetical protein
MLNDFIVVESAISAFNNAALWMPAFLWWTILALPLFVVIYWCADTVMTRIGWTRKNILDRATMWVAGLTCAWVVMFGGNYAVLRDSLSILPMMTATILFLTSLFVSSHLRTIALPKMNWWRWVLVVLLIIAVGLSDTHAWWGPILQIGALILGILLGRVAHGAMRPFGGMVLIMMMVAIAILMQPEFFRFGQLGNLTAVHLLAMLALGCACMMTIAVQNINPRNKIRYGVYIKLKWLMRVVCALGVALFILTEAVPVFIGTMIAVFLSIALSVWHADRVNIATGDKMFAIALMTFGAITVMPVITAIGILYWANTDNAKIWAETKPLL